MSRLEDLKDSPPEPWPTQYLTAGEVEDLAKRELPSFVWFEEELFFPQSSTRLTAPHSASREESAPLDGFDGTDNIPHFRLIFDHPTGIPMLHMHNNPAHDRTSGADELSLCDDSLDTATYAYATSPNSMGPGWNVPRTRLVMYAEFRDPLAALAADWANRDGPPDAGRGPIEIPGRQGVGAGAVSDAQAQAMRELFEEAHGGPNAGDAAARTRLDPDVIAMAKAFCFLEYYLVYAFNDNSTHQSNPVSSLTAGWLGDHPGDVEASAVYAYHRDDLMGLPKDEPERSATLAELQPAFLIEMGHEYDSANDFVIPLDGPDPHRTARTVYLAGGSHAAAPTAATTEAINRWIASTLGTDEADLWDEAVMAALWPFFPAIVLLAECGDVKDKRSEKGHNTRVGGVGTSMGHDTDDSLSRQGPIVVTVPLGKDKSIYDGAHDRLLGLRSFPGTWGLDSGVRWRPKTGRALRVLADHLS